MARRRSREEQQAMFAKIKAIKTPTKRRGKLRKEFQVRNQVRANHRIESKLPRRKEKAVVPHVRAKPPEEKKEKLSEEQKLQFREDIAELKRADDELAESIGKDVKEVVAVRVEREKNQRIRLQQKIKELEEKLN